MLAIDVATGECLRTALPGPRSSGAGILVADGRTALGGRRHVLRLSPGIPGGAVDRQSNRVGVDPDPPGERDYRVRRWVDRRPRRSLGSFPRAHHPVATRE